VLTSPLKRTLQTVVAGLPQVLHKDAARRPELVIDPDLQERSDLPCDTGSGRLELSEIFPDLNFGDLDDEWFVKVGLYAADDDAVTKRAQRFRERLREISASLVKDIHSDTERPRTNVAVVTHGVFMKYLAEDDSIDLPKAGWKAFTVGTREDGSAVLIPSV
jgi:broad specificity phosphatase PhoE